MTEEDYKKEAAFIQAEIEFKENFELEMEFTQKPANIAVQTKDGFLNYGTVTRRLPFKGVIQK